MKKMIKILENVTGFNNFLEVSSFEHVNGSQQDVYFRLIQKNAVDCSECDHLRWLPSGSATLSIRFDSLDNVSVITRTATMVYPNDDRSIFKVTILSTESITGFITAILSDGGINETLTLDGRLNTSTSGSGRFFC